MIFVIDIDGTLSTNSNGNYKTHIPYYDRIARINRLYDSGNVIILYTARGTTSGKDWSDLTIKQLKYWGVKYHKLLFGKLQYDIWIDDKAVNANDFFKE